MNQQAIRAIRESKERAEAALTNEQITRQRVAALEEGLESLRADRLANSISCHKHGAILGRTLLGRLRWLLTGR